MKPALRVMLCDDAGERFFGEGPCRLLHLIEETGSLRSAAAQMGLSYSKALAIVKRAEAELVCRYLDPDDRVFYVGQGDNGEGWFSAVFDFYPILVDYSGTVTTDPDTGETKMIGGGGELGLPELQPGEGVKSTYYHAFTAEELDSIVRGNGCTVLYIQTLDDIFVQSYADLFTDKLAAAQSGETLLYRVTDAGFAPMQMEVSAR